MGAITRGFANNIGSSGILGAGAFNDASLGSITEMPGVVTMNLLSTTTISSDATVSITANIDSTYNQYWFLFTNIHPEENDRHLKMQVSTNGGSSYGVSTTNTNWRAAHKEDGSFTFFGEITGNSVAQSTSSFIINEGMGNPNDGSCSGFLKLFSPSGTTHMKHYETEFSSMNFQSPPQTVHYFTSGQFETTSAINAVQFTASSGNLDSGTIKLYGVC